MEYQTHSIEIHSTESQNFIAPEVEISVNMSAEIALLSVGP